MTWTTAEYRSLSRDELDVLATLTIELTKLRQNECKHLAVENVGPEIFGKLIDVFIRGGNSAAGGRS